MTNKCTYNTVATVTRCSRLSRDMHGPAGTLRREYNTMLISHRGYQIDFVHLVTWLDDITNQRLWLIKFNKGILVPFDRLPFFVCLPLLPLHLSKDLGAYTAYFKVRLDD